MIEIGNRNIRILMVDDSLQSIEDGKQTLINEGYDVYIAGTAETALELLCAISFDMALISIQMPQLDGFEILNIMKENEHSKDIPVILMAEKLDVETVVKGFMYGAVDYIRKPFVELELVTRVKNHAKMKSLSDELRRKTSDLKEAYNLLEFVNTTDPLTNLCNRKEIISRIENEQAKHERYARVFSVIAADIDDYTSIYDNYGRRFGHFLIASVAELITDGMRKQDSAARLDGSRFLFLLPETGCSGAKTFAEKIKAKVKRHEFIKGTQKANVTMTCGISVYDREQSPDELMDRAEKALYEGKKKGGNCVIALEA